MKFYYLMDISFEYELKTQKTLMQMRNLYHNGAKSYHLVMFAMVLFQNS